MPVRDITEIDVQTWELQLDKEGTLPPEVQLRLLEHVADRTVVVDLAQPQHTDGFGVFAADGRRALSVEEFRKLGR